MAQRSIGLSSEEYRAKLSNWGWNCLGLASAVFAVLGTTMGWAPWVTAGTTLASGAIGYFAGRYAVSQTFHLE